VAVRELLLQLAGQSRLRRIVREEGPWLIRFLGNTHRCWERCQPTRSGTGTKMTIALRPWPTSICKIPGQREAFQCPPPLQQIEKMSPYSCSYFIFISN
jgi:hypothetical protein